MRKMLCALLVSFGLLVAGPAMAHKLKKDPEALRAEAATIAAIMVKAKCSDRELKKTVCTETIQKLQPLITRIEYLILNGD